MWNKDICTTVFGCPLLDNVTLTTKDGFKAVIIFSYAIEDGNFEISGKLFCVSKKDMVIPHPHFIDVYKKTISLERLSRMYSPDTAVKDLQLTIVGELENILNVWSFNNMFES